MLVHVFWSKEFSKKFVDILEREFNDENTEDKLWETIFIEHIEKLGNIQEWAGVFSLFHWSFIPWGFYLVLAVAFGFMLHVRKRN